ncbi:hypothetical protein Tco_0273341 [Tanacetum coccineum]
MRHGLYVTIVCYVLLAIVVDHGTRSVPLFVVLECDRSCWDCDVSVDRRLLWICYSERVRLHCLWIVDCSVFRLIVVDSGDTFPFPCFSLISLNRGSFDVIVGIDRLSKRKFVIEQLSFMEAKVDEPKVGDISVVRDFVDVFPEDFSGLPPQQQVEFCIGQGVGLEGRGTRVSYDLVIFREKHQCCFLRREAWSSFEVSVGIAEEGEVVTYLRFIVNFSKIVKPITSLTKRNQKYEWGAERKEAFQTLKNDFCDASINRMQWLMR